MNHDLHIVVVDAEGELHLGYLGNDSSEANDIFSRVNAKAETARLFLYAQPSRVRHPAEEAAASERRHKLADLAANEQLTGLLAKLKVAQEGHARHEDLVAQLTKDIRAIAPELLPTPAAPVLPPVDPSAAGPTPGATTEFPKANAPEGATASDTDVQDTEAGDGVEGSEIPAGFEPPAETASETVAVLQVEKPKNKKGKKK